MRVKAVSPDYYHHRKSRKRSFPWLLLLTPFVLWMGVRSARLHFEQPDAILVLGGAEEREIFSAKFAKQHPNLPVWISSGAPRDYAERVFSRTGVDLQRLNLDYQAVDTVTNFTSLVDRLRQKNVRSVYLITSDYHMRRAQVIGEIVFGSRGINIQPVSIPSNHADEPLSKALRDGGRAVLWVATGQTGAQLAPVKER
ncbi:YdcF family protein [Leptolyngbya sp. AN03gr2]|uniref:YdcF family protein n=1 Tax=unclassified Leptolyngbya TaxID=2650499 RepID=UPI003D3212C5